MPPPQRTAATCNVQQAANTIREEQYGPRQQVSHAGAVATPNQMRCVGLFASNWLAWAQNHRTSALARLQEGAKVLALVFLHVQTVLQCTKKDVMHTMTNLRKRLSRSVAKVCSGFCSDRRKLMYSVFPVMSLVSTVAMPPLLKLFAECKSRSKGAHESSGRRYTTMLLGDTSLQMRAASSKNVTGVWGLCSLPPA